MKYLSSLSLLRALGLADQKIAAGRSGNGSAHQQKILFGIYLHYAQILDGLALVPHVPWKMLSRPHPRRERTGANAARRAMKHGAVCGIASAVVPALDAALKSLALAYARDVHELAGRKAVHQNAIADFRFVAR